MVLKVGMAGKASFIPLLKKTNMFECGKNGVVLELEKGVITLYATNARCNEIYAIIPLGTSKALFGRALVVVAYSEDVMLVDGGDLRVVIDFEEKAVAVNKPEIQVQGRKHWGEDVQIDWDYDYNEFFTAPITYAQ